MNNKIECPECGYKILPFIVRTSSGSLLFIECPRCEADITEYTKEEYQRG